MTNFDKLSAMLVLVLVLFFSIKDSSSFPLLRKIEDIEKNSVVVVEDVQNNQQIIQEENFENVDLLNMMNPIFDNWLDRERLAVEDSLEKKKQGGENENLQKPKLSDLRSFTKRPVTLGYWNWHWRRK